VLSSSSFRGASSKSQRFLPTASTQAKITWSQQQIGLTLLPGLGQVKSLTFSSTVNLQDAVIEPVPEIARFLTVQPNSFVGVLANQQQAVTINFSIPSNTAKGTYQGTIHIRDRSRTFPQTLKVRIEILDPLGFSLTEIAAESSIVVLGTVTSKQSSYDQLGKRIFSQVTINPSRFIKGSASSPNLIISVPGGTIEHVAQYVSGTPSFDVNEVVLLFLTGPNSDNKYEIPDGALGKYTIVDDPIKGQIAIIDPNYTDIEFVEPMHPDLQTFLARSQQQIVPLSELLNALGVNP
jgi:hypothetical protein